MAAFMTLSDTVTGVTRKYQEMQRKTEAKILMKPRRMNHSYPTMLK